MRQLARIECREARLRRIRAKLSNAGQLQDEETVVADPQKHHHISCSQNNYHHIGTFLRNNAGDPAVKVGVVCVIDSCKPDKNYLAFLAEVKGAFTSSNLIETTR